ncbi:LytTR family DNA-binding domain-containing protein [Oceanicaulis sp.]|uniref:LytTR family DNA-binding domain-containing protein n=2 Tax=Oceanicaulis TaxID=153232 RepID=UPI003D2CA935
MTDTASPIRMLNAQGYQIVIDLGVMALAGLFLALVGPFATIQESLPLRLVYWIGVMVAGGGLLAVGERLFSHLLPQMALWRRVLTTAAVITAPQTGVVIAAEALVFDNPVSLVLYARLLPAVLIISIAALSVMLLTRTALSRPAIAGPEPGGEALEPDLLAQHLPAPLRGAEILALQAEDHYVRIHTDAGSHLVLMRFADAIALAETTRPGHRLHRSWWAATDAITAIKYNRGSGQAELKGAITAPVSRSSYPALREAGWFSA